MYQTKQKLLTHKLTLVLAGIATVGLLSDAIAAPKSKWTRPVVKFERLDTNGDGFVDLDELLGPALRRTARRFDRKDVDDSGYLSFEEFATGRTGRDLSDIADEIVACVADIKEATGSEKIKVPSPDQFLSPEEKFDALDTDGDQLVSLDEALAAITQKVGTAFRKADANGDSLLSLREFKAHLASGIATRRAIRACVAEIQDEDNVI